MANTVDLGDIGLDANSPRVDKILRNIIDGQATLPEVDENSPNIDKLLHHIATNGGIGGSTSRVGVWFNGTTTPNTTTPKDAKEGDYYLNTNDKKYYVKDLSQATGWRQLGTLQGVGVADISELFSGAGTPAEVGHVGEDNDHHLDSRTGEIWKKVNGQWSKLISLMGQPGIAGAPGQRGDKGDKGDPGTPGSTWHVGAQRPAVANEGDFYLDSNGQVFKMINTSWVDQNVNIKGAKGDPGQAGSSTNVSSAGTIKYPSIERTYQSGWQNAYGDTTGMVRYYKIGEMVNMHGIVNGVGKSTNTYGQHMFTLSAGYRPKRVMYFPVATFNDWAYSVPSVGMISIETDGRVRFYGGYTQLISLAGVTFTVNH